MILLISVTISLLLIVSTTFGTDYNVQEQLFSYRLQYARNVSQLLDTLLNDYDKDIRPDFEDSLATQVNIDIAVRSMGPISEQDMCYSMDCYFRQTWKDGRLKFRSDTEEALTLGASMLDKIWKPDTYFWNGQDSYLHRLTVPNRFIRLKQDGTIQYSSRLTIKAKCPMYLHNFPLDVQKCPLFIGSYAYQSKDVIYIWRKGVNDSVTANPHLELSQYVLKNIVTGFTNGTRETKEGDFSVLTVYFLLDRHIGYFLINFYAPCTLIVVLSWVAFWINREATADRIGLGATSILTMTFMAQDSKQDLPKVTYATALDIYMVLCYFFLLATIAEFSLVHTFTKYNSGDAELNKLENEIEKKYKNTQVQENHASQEKNGDIFTVQSSTTVYRKKKLETKSYSEPAIFRRLYNHWSKSSLAQTKFKNYVNSTSEIDRVARILFPLCFAFISIVYWCTYWRNS